MVQQMRVDGESDLEEEQHGSLPKNWHDNHETALHFFRDSFDDPNIFCDYLYYTDYTGNERVVPLGNTQGHALVTHKVSVFFLCLSIHHYLEIDCNSDR